MFKVLTVVGVAGVALGADVSSASASGSGMSSSAGVEKSRAKYKTREIDVNQDTKMVKLESKYRDKDTGYGSRQIFEITGTRNSDLRVRSTFESYNKTSEVKVGTSYRTRFMAIVEYTDSDASKSYTDGDGIVSFYRLGLDRGNKNTSTITAPNVASPGGWKIDPVSKPTDTATGIYSLHAETLDKVFQIDFQFSNAPQTDAAGNILATPTQSKFSVTIMDYPYQGKDTRLALLTRTESKAKAVEKAADDEVKSKSVTKQVSFGADAAIQWSNEFTATVAGASTTQAVLTSVPTPITANTPQKLKEDDGEKDDTGRDGETPALLVFSFDAVQPSKIYWDPTVGTGATIDAEPTAATTTSSSSASMATASSFLVATILAIAALF